MTFYEQMCDLSQKDILFRMYKKGVLSAKIFTYMEYYQKYKEYVHTGLPNPRAREKVADMAGCDPRTILRAITLLQE
jgi:hypothetical protein